MKKIILLIFSVFVAALAKAQEPKFEWAKTMGGIGHENIQSIGLDKSGNVYTTGSFEGTADFDPDSNRVFNMTTFGEPDVFICKLDSSGNFVWAKQFGGNY